MNEAIAQLSRDLETRGYIAGREVTTTLYLAQQMQKPLLVEGDAGVGKTELAKVWAQLLDAELIRLQCYEGLDAQAALYEWDYARQLLALRVREAANAVGPESEAGLYQREYLLERPLLRAITHDSGPVVLLIDEIDRADGAFEAFLLEILSDFQVTIPELGTLRAEQHPYVVLTSNRTRELGDALRRRCLYLYLDHPSFEKEVQILKVRHQRVPDQLAREVAAFVEQLRGLQLIKPPGVAESLDFTEALLELGQDRLAADVVLQTLGCLLKDQADLATVNPARVGHLVSQVRHEDSA